MSGERPPRYSDDGVPMAERIWHTPEDEQPPKRKLDPDDPRVRKLGEIATREAAQVDRNPPPDREAPPERRDREDTPTRPDREG